MTPDLSPTCCVSEQLSNIDGFWVGLELDTKRPVQHESNHGKGRFLAVARAYYCRLPPPTTSSTATAELLPLTRASREGELRLYQNIAERAAFLCHLRGVASTRHSEHVDCRGRESAPPAVASNAVIAEHGDRLNCFPSTSMLLPT